MTNTTLARRLDQHPRFRWMAGMLARNPANGDVLRVIDADQYGVYCERYEFNLDELEFAGLDDWARLEFAGLDDWASVGCLWHLLCEALPEHYYAFFDSDGDCQVDGPPDGMSVYFGTVPEALLWAWERSGP
ncbi:hypothetical protein CMI37_09460 [Candidatus Pacearchaeota archaeon]|nr:hypothetical protein [Candidatus Pacearchaeota archaeon]